MIKRTPQFKKKLKKLPNALQKKAFEQIYLLNQNIFNHRLKTHKLEPKKYQYYSCSITYDIRIIFRLEKKHIVLITIGTHDEIY